MAKLFGTDGARGVANRELTSEIAFRLGQAAVKFLGRTIVVGKDTRLSGDMLEASLVAGVMSMGGCALAAGIIPTPAIALLTRTNHADAGVVISASHNPPEYNGIKFFDKDGFKLPVSLEEQIESYVLAGGEPAENLPNGDAVGHAISLKDAAETTSSLSAARFVEPHSTLISVPSQSSLMTMTSAPRRRKASAELTLEAP